MITLDGNLNSTYVAYNFMGSQKLQEVVVVHRMNASLSKSAAIKRGKVKGNSKVYNQASWDLEDAKEKDGEAFFDKLDKKTLPDSLKNKTTDELKLIVAEKSKKRTATQKQIAELNTKRDAYIATERVKNATNKTTNMETEVERIIKEQAKRYKMIVQ